MSTTPVTVVLNAEVKVPPIVRLFAAWDHFIAAAAAVEIPVDTAVIFESGVAGRRMRGIDPPKPAWVVLGVAATGGAHA